MTKPNRYLVAETTAQAWIERLQNPHHAHPIQWQFAQAIHGLCLWKAQTSLNTYRDVVCTLTAPLPGCAMSPKDLRNKLPFAVVTQGLDPSVVHLVLEHSYGGEAVWRGSYQDLIDQAAYDRADIQAHADQIPATVGPIGADEYYVAIRCPRCAEEVHVYPNESPNWTAHCSQCGLTMRWDMVRTGVKGRVIVPGEGDQ